MIIRGWRAIPGDTPTAALRIFHPAVDNGDSNRDPNPLFPLDRLRELAAEGVIGAINFSALASVHNAPSHT